MVKSKKTIEEIVNLFVKNFNERDWPPDAPNAHIDERINCLSKIDALVENCVYLSILSRGNHRGKQATSAAKKLLSLKQKYTVAKIRESQYERLEEDSKKAVKSIDEIIDDLMEG